MKHQRSSGAKGTGRAPEAPPTAIWPFALIALAGALSYANSLAGPFIFDDQLSVLENPGIRQWWKLAAVLSPARELPTAGRPLVNLSLALNYAWGGLSVVGYHLVNLACHLVTGVTLFAFLRRTLELPTVAHWFKGRATSIACATALLWVLHPLNTEAVNYVTQRTELMMGLFYLSTLYASLRATDRSGRGWSAVAVLSCAAGMGCKESMVTAPLMVVLYDGIFVFESLRHAVAERWRLYAALMASWILLAAAIWSGPRVHSAGFASGVSPWTYLLNQTTMIVEYLRRAAWPRSLVSNYGFPMPLELADVWAAATLVVGLLALTVAALVLRPKWGFLGAWFFVTLAPTSSVVPIATEVGAERRMYLPLMAVVALAIVGASFAKWTRSAIGGGAVAMVALLLSAGTIARNREYVSELELARTTVDRYPTPVGHHVLASNLIRAGNETAAMAELRLALPGDPRAHYTVASQLLKNGDPKGAIAEFQAFLRERPLLLEAVSARQMLGQALITERRWSEAIEQEQMVLTMNPSSAERTNAHGLLGDAYFGSGEFERAIPHYEEYLRARPADVAALMHDGVALVAVGRIGEATEAFRRAAQIDEKNADVQRNLANALYDQQQYAEALVHAEKAVALRPADADAHELLGRCLALAGRFDDARAHFERALQLNPAFAEAREDLRKLALVMRAPVG